MRKFFITWILMLLGAGAMAVSSFDTSTNVLSLDSVVVNGVTYSNVTVRLNSFTVLTVGSSSQPQSTTSPATNPGTTPATTPVAVAAPVANAGSPQTVFPGSQITPSKVTLDGSASADPSGAALTYAWTLTSKPSGSNAAITSPNTAITNIWVDGPGIYVASLVVSNGSVSSAPSTVVITAAFIGNAVANPGADQNVKVLTRVNLDGSASYDPTGIAVASYQWTLISAPTGSIAALTNANGAIAQFIPNVVGDYVFELQVGAWRNGGINYTYERTTVHVQN